MPDRPLDLTYRGSTPNNQPQPTNFPITLETGVKFGGNEKPRGIKLNNTDYTPNFAPYGWGYGMDLKTQDASMKDMKSILPDTNLGDYDDVHYGIMRALRENGGANIQASLIKRFKDAPVQQKMILANTLASLFVDKTYNDAVYDGKGVRTDTDTLYRALQRSVNIGENVPAGVCSHIHIAVAQLLSGLGLSSSVMTVAQTGSIHVVSGLDMRKEGLGYMIIDYGKVYQGRDRMEAIQIYEKEVGAASIKNYIADKNGKIIGEIETPVGEEYAKLMHGQSFDQLMDNGKMKEGVKISLYLQDGKPVGGVDAVKYLTDNLYVRGTLARSQVPGATIDGARVALGYHIINTASSHLTAEVNYGQTNTNWGNTRSKDHHLSASLQGSADILRGKKGALTAHGGARVAFQQNTDASDVKGSTLVPSGGLASLDIGVSGNYNFDNGVKFGGSVARKQSPSGNVGNFNSEDDLKSVRLGNKTDTIKLSVEKGNVGVSYMQEKSNISNAQSVGVEYKPNDKTTMSAGYSERRYNPNLGFSDTATTTVGIHQKLSDSSEISAFIQSTRSNVRDILGSSNPGIKGGVTARWTF